MMLPSPAKVLNTFIYKLCGGVNPDGATLLQHIAASMKIALGGYVVGVIIGVPLGIAMAWNRKFEMFDTGIGVNGGTDESSEEDDADLGPVADA